MMRVAVCIRGEIRTWEQCKRFLVNMVDDSVEVDYFFFTWDVDRQAGLYETTYSPIDMNSIMRAFRGKKLISFNVKSIADITKRPKSVRATEWKMYESWHLCNNMKIEHERKNNFTYDCVIAVRPDVVSMKTGVPSAEWIGDMQGVLYNDRCIDEDSKFYSDLLFVSTSKNIDTLCNYHDHIRDMPQEEVPEDVAHRGLYDYLINQGLQLGTSRHYEHTAIIRTDFPHSVTANPSGKVVEAAHSFDSKWKNALRDQNRDRYT